MLTRDDLQAIEKLLDERLDYKLEQKLAPIRQYLKDHSKSLTYLKKKVNRIDKTVDIIGRTYDQRIVDNTKSNSQNKILRWNSI